MRLNVHSSYTYTLETIIQAGQKSMAITWVPVRTNPQLRPSRLMRSSWSYVNRSIGTILRVFVVYKPFRFFMTIGALVFGAGVLIGLRFLYHYFSGSGQGMVQSLILASILLGIGFQTMLVAFLADLQAVNRRLLEDLQYAARSSSKSGE
jgi:hypothetical protein